MWIGICESDGRREIGVGRGGGCTVREACNHITTSTSQYLSAKKVCLTSLLTPSLTPTLIHVCASPIFGKPWHVLYLAGKSEFMIKFTSLNLAQ